MKCKAVRSGDGFRCRFCGNIFPSRGGKLPECGVTYRPVEVQPLPDEKDFGSCVHRGELLRVEECKPCQSGGRVPEIFACEVHGECTLFAISKRKSDGGKWNSCLGCEDRASLS